MTSVLLYFFCFYNSHSVCRDVTEIRVSRTCEKLLICCVYFSVVAGDQVEEDDIHLILEYKKGEKWGKYKAPRSNRLENMHCICCRCRISSKTLHQLFNLSLLL